MKTLCAFLLLIVTAGCCDCGWGTCGWGGCGGSSCPAPGAVGYSAQPKAMVAADQQQIQSQVDRAGAVASKTERQVQYYDGNQPATYVR